MPTNYQSVPIPVRRWRERLAAFAETIMPPCLVLSLSAFLAAAVLGFAADNGRTALNLSVVLVVVALVALALDLWNGARTEREAAATLRSVGVPVEVAAVAAPLVRPSARYSGREIGETVADGYRIAARVTDPLARTPSVEVTWAWA